tara:strand:- start:687 stop:953 length:267 start_codon:yes stop_codon:yes gene_type:complete
MSWIYDKFTEEEIEKLYGKGKDWHPSGAMCPAHAKKEDGHLFWWMDLISDEMWVKDDWTCDKLIETLDVDVKNGLGFDECHKKYCVNP